MALSKGQSPTAMVESYVHLYMAVLSLMLMANIILR